MHDSGLIVNLLIRWYILLQSKLFVFIIFDQNATTCLS